ncbi:flagellar hook-length control protein FliK [Cryptosporangium aurantiacum]|uniref:Hook-length control protein FliK n=1 Tax=Cryptosporangium aurantiacum TaxID=134849 RepID=A0A1M7R705_9ACTN|nr:flagellar hook-length control protein FliK [Cryptosporangium aurantiacum]SHN42033.1 hook-length control protein FliK [Cryptosporangium aurantiacum]
MSILPLPPATTTAMSLAAATNSVPARPAGEMGTDNGGRQRQEQDEEFVSALQAASSSKGAEDATVSERGPSEGPRRKAAARSAEEDTDRRAVLTGQTWHTTMTGMPAPDAAGALALPAALLAHGQLALGTTGSGDINADAPPVAVVGIGVVTEPEGGVPGGPALKPAALGNATGLTGFPGLTGLADAGAPGLTVVDAAQARPAVEAAITANADSAAAAAAFAGETVAPEAGAGRPNPVPGVGGATPTAGAFPLGLRPVALAPGVAGAGTETGVPVPGATAAVPGTTGPGMPGAGVPGPGTPVTAAVPGTAVPGTTAEPGTTAGQGTAAATGTAVPGVDLGAAVGTPATGTVPPAGGPPDAAAAALAAGPPTVPTQPATGWLGQLNPATQAGAVPGIGADAAAQAVAAAPIPAPGGPLPAPAAPPGLTAYTPATGVDAGPAGDDGTGEESEQRGAEGTAMPEATFAPTPAAAGPDPNLITPNLATPDLGATTSVDLTGAGAAEQAPAPPPAAQVADQIIPLRTQGDGVHRIAMELRPDDLGTIGVVAEIRNGQVHLHFTGANELTRETLRAALPELRQQLEDAGFAGAAFDFTEGSGAGQNDRRGFGAADQGFGNQPGRGGQRENPGGENPRPTGQRPPGYAEPTTPGTSRHALDLQV